MKIIHTLISGALILFSEINASDSNQEFRSTWVITWNHIDRYKNPSQNMNTVRTIMDNHAAANMNAVIFQVRQSGTAYYQSSYEPWGYYSGYQYPGYDPLELAIEEAHSRGMELHAWFNVFQTSSTHAGSPAAEHPEWICRDQSGNVMTSYRSLSPGLQDVRDYTIQVAMEIVQNYDVDGLHLDYVRWNEHTSANQRSLPITEQIQRMDGTITQDEIDEINLNVKSLKSKHFFIKTDKTNVMEKLERQIAFRNAPVFTLSYFMHAQISESMNKEGFKVSLSGTGADELFTGYYDHYNFWLAEMSQKKNFNDLINDWKQGYGKNVRNDYLKDPFIISTDFQVYEIYYYMEMEEEEDEREIDCSDCDGYGTHDEDCDMCDGTGEEEMGTDEEGEPIMEPCPDCEGAGEVANDCDWCGGSGYEAEQFTEYTVEEWRNVYVSKNKNIECPPTMSTPFKGGDTENDWAEPASFNKWMNSIPKDYL